MSDPSGAADKAMASAVRRRYSLNKVRPAVSEYPPQRRKHYGMDEPADGERANQQQDRYDPGRGKREDRARLIQFRLNILEYVLPHDAQMYSKTPARTGGFVRVPDWTVLRASGI